MRRIRKPAAVPEILKDGGTEQTRKDCEAYDQNSNIFRSGLTKFPFYARIYAAESVKETLKRAQYGKCCYCESKFLSTSYGAVEHFRPKGGVQQNERQDLQYPGYYWLAYDWNNLLFSCERCNTSHKRNLFPLLDETKRAVSHHDDITKEQPLLINPAQEDPQEHLHFREEAVIGDTEKGLQTIEALGLMRKDLWNERHSHLSILKALHDVLEACHRLVKSGYNSTSLMKEAEEAAERIRHHSSCEAKYSAMARDFFNSVNLSTADE